MVVAKNFNKVVLLIALISLLLLPLPAGSLWWRELFNSGHVILFIFISLVLYFQINAAQRSLSPTKIYLLVLVLGFSLGILIELLQGLLQREASIDDIYKNFIGTMTGLTLASLVRQKLVLNRVLLGVVLLAFIGLGMFSFVRLSWHYIQRNAAFPTLVVFDESWSTSFVRFNNAELIEGVGANSSNDGKRYQVRFDAGKYPSISILEPEKNWSAYRSLHFSVFSASEKSIKLVLRIHDARHNNNYNDRFNRSYIIQPGINDVTVSLSDVQNAPEGRNLNLTNIAGVQLFLVNNDVSLFLEVSNIFLKG